MIDAAVAQAEAIARQADDALDEVERRVDGIVEDDDVAAVDGVGGEGAEPGWELGLACLLTRRKSPTRRVGSMEAEGIRKGCSEKVMMKRATVMM